jgi:hypothetical protein
MLGWGDERSTAMSSKSRSTATMGIDIGKNSFHVIGLDERGAIVLRQKWSPAVCYLQCDVSIKRRAVDRIPAVTYVRRPHYQRSSRRRAIAGLSGFFTLSQSRDRPDR